MSSSRSRRQVRLSRALGIPLTPKAVRYYAPTDNGHEAMLTKRLAMIRNLLKKR